MEFTKQFRNDLVIMNEALKNKEKFAFSKYADAEIGILLNKNIRSIDNWVYEPNQNDKIKNLLMESINHSDDGYYVGISCPCCDMESYNWYKENVKINESNITFANIFVNTNYEYFVNEMLPTFNTFENIYLIANQNSNLTEIKTVLNYTKFFGVTANAIENDLGLIDQLIEEINTNKIENTLFLFCCGPLGKVLSYKLWENNKNNTYIDIGSTLNRWTCLNLRDYQLNGMYSNRTCVF